jgi:hypothetical protein
MASRSIISDRCTCNIKLEQFVYISGLLTRRRCVTILSILDINMHELAPTLTPLLAYRFLQSTYSISKREEILRER